MTTALIGLGLLTLVAVGRGLYVFWRTGREEHNRGRHHQ